MTGFPGLKSGVYPRLYFSERFYFAACQKFAPRVV